ncbi:MAG: hypothetical protein V2I32_13830 [Desulforhopalus sp.]|nr:hypothetical protein [Desulforhopalus sp.]
MPQFAHWLPVLLLSLVLVVVGNALLASCTDLYYRRKAWGQLSHSQLRIKQGRAELDHRLNVFFQALVFGLVSPRLYLFAGVLLLLYWGIFTLAKT